MTNEVFARTWGDRAGPIPDTEYGPALIDRCKETHPDFPFLAEVYWDMEWTLQQQGLTSATTSGYTTASHTTRPSRSAANCTPTPTTRSA